jgi:hypothetical protein
MSPDKKQKPGTTSFLSLLRQDYGPFYLSELEKAQEFNKMQTDLVMPEVRQNLNNDQLLNKPVTVAREGTFPEEGQARFMNRPEEQEKEKRLVANDNIYKFDKDGWEAPKGSPYAESKDGSTAFSYAPIDLLGALAAAEAPNLPPNAAAGQHPGIQIRAEDWPGVMSNLQRSHFKKTKQRFTPETFNAYLDSQKDVPWTLRFQDAGDEAPIFRVLNIMRDGTQYMQRVEPNKRKDLQKSQDYYHSLIRNLPGIVKKEHPTAKQLFG